MINTNISYINLFKPSELKVLVAWHLMLEGVQHSVICTGDNLHDKHHESHYEARVGFVISNGRTVRETRAKVQQEAIKAIVETVIEVTEGAPVIIHDIEVTADEVCTSYEDGIRIECVMWLKEMRQIAADTSQIDLPKLRREERRSKAVSQWSK